jgi:hypothetical protein
VNHWRNNILNEKSWKNKFITQLITTASQAGNLLTAPLLSGARESNKVQLALAG